MTREQKPLPDFSQPPPDLTISDLHFLRQVEDRRQAALALRARVAAAQRRLYAQREALADRQRQPRRHHTAVSRVQTWEMQA